MQQVDVVYLYEHAARELDVACAVASLLETRHGLSVEIVQWNAGFHEAAARVFPRLVILPYCYEDEGYKMLLAFWREAIFLNLSWEQLFYLGNRKAKTPRGDFSLKHVIHHAWSTEFAAFLRDAGVPDANLFLNGQPAYALYKKPYDQYFATRADLSARYHLDTSLSWVFFPENYNWAFYSEATIQRFVKNGQSPEDIRVMRDYCLRSLSEVLVWCVSAIQKVDVEIILRPRPSTPLDEFNAFVEQTLGKIPDRLHIIQQESVREWILASDMVVSSHSTSLIEAAIAGKPVGILEPFAIPSQLHVSWQDLIPHISSYEDFTRALQDPSLVKQASSLEEWARKKMMSQGDPIGNLAAHIGNILSGEVKAPAPAPRELVTPWLKWTPPVWPWAAYRRLKLLIRHFATWGVAPEYVKEYLSFRSVRAQVERWKEILA